MRQPYNGEEILARAKLMAFFLNDKYPGLEPRKCVNQGARIGEMHAPLGTQHLLWKLQTEIPALIQERKFKAARKAADWTAGALWGLGCTQLGESNAF